MDSIFRVRFGQDSYPISRFIIERARVLSLSRSDVAGRLGYRDIAKAHRALDAALTTGTVPEHMRKHLATVLQVDNRIVEAVIAATLRQQSDEARARMLDRERQYVARFRPHLRAVTQRTVPQPIFLAALLTTARLLHVQLRPDVWSATPEHRDRLVREAIRDHYREHKRAIASVRRDHRLQLGRAARLFGGLCISVRHQGRPGGTTANGQTSCRCPPWNQARRRAPDRIAAEHDDHNGQICRS